MFDMEKFKLRRHSEGTREFNCYIMLAFARDADRVWYVSYHGKL